MSQLNLNTPAKAGAHQLRGRKVSLQKPEECVMIRTLRTGVMVPSTHSGERTQQLPNTDSSEQGEV